MSVPELYMVSQDLMILSFSRGSQMSTSSLVSRKPLYCCDSFSHLPVLPLNRIRDKELSDVYTQSKTEILYRKAVRIYLFSATVVDRRCFEQFPLKHPSLLANMKNTCRGFVIIKPGLGLDSEKDAIKTMAYLG